jgi:cell division protease FtsH
MDGQQPPRFPMPRPRVSAGLAFRLALALPLFGALLGLLVVRAGPFGSPVLDARPAAAAASTAVPASVSPLVFDRTWTMADLVRAADAGTVTEVDATERGAATASTNSTGSVAKPTLFVRTTDGTLALITDVTVPEGVATLRLLGYGRLLTQSLFSSAGGPAPGSTTLPWLFPGLLLVGMVAGSIVMARRRQSVDRGSRSRWRRDLVTRPKGAGQGDPATVPTISLDDIAGVDEAKLELTETIEFLKDPARFTRLGAKPVRGVMLFGPPGTGKTMLARGVAAEAGVPFFSASGAEFVEKFVGVGASRIREIFTAARAAGRGVIFVDEIDAIAKVRGGINSNDEREQTLNQLLVEMDGFTADASIVVIGATNRLDTLDPAVLRPGRFTRKIHVGLPDRDSRRAILAVHAKDKPLDPTVDLEAVARKTFGFSGAGLADLLNEAAILAARDHRESVTANDVQRGWLKVAVGSSRARSMDERERSIIAGHEAGHAICGWAHGDKRRVEEISLYQHGEALGVTVSSSEDNALPSGRDLRARLVALMGGRVAEEILFQDSTPGASNDFDVANDLATSMVTRWGMGHDPEATDGGATGRGILSTFVKTERGVVPTAVLDAQGRAIRAILDDAYQAARVTLLAELARLNRVSAYLVEHERIDGDEFEALMAGRLLPQPTEDWRSIDAQPRPRAEIAAFAAASVKAPWVPTPAPVPVAVPIAPGPYQPNRRPSGPREPAGRRPAPAGSLWRLGRRIARGVQARRRRSATVG